MTQFVFAELPAPVPKTGQTTSYQAGDDGDLKSGVAWPVPRFTVVTNGVAQTVVDNLTGLEWVQAPHSLPGNSGTMVWNGAIDFCNNLIYAGHSDWRVPSIKELESVVNCGNFNLALPAGHPFSGVQYNYYWSGTAVAYNRGSAWFVYMGTGYLGNYNKTYFSYVWPVRGGQRGSTHSVSSGETMLDARDYTLAVSSAHGSPVPSIGTNGYAWRAVVTCSVPSSVIDQGVKWKNTGWAGTGAVPTSGITNATGEIILTNLESSITWNWETDFAITNVTAVQRTGTKLVDITYDLISDLTNRVPICLQVKSGTSVISSDSFSGDLGTNVLPGTGRQIIWDAGVDWGGDASDLTFTVLHMSAIDSISPSGMVRIPDGTNSGTDPDFGDYSLVITNSFFMDETEVTKAKWDAVRTWAITNGYGFDNVGSGKETNHPVQMINRHDCMKWCNARSQMEGRDPCYMTNGVIYKAGQNTNVVCNFSANGYRLPSGVEWAYAARGGLTGKRFPWGDSIAHSNANYYSSSSYSYDISPTRGYHPTYAINGAPYTSPAGSFPANGYGLYDMAGNVWERCWDSHRGGAWGDQLNGLASDARCGNARVDTPGSVGNPYNNVGFRSVCNPDITNPDFLFSGSSKTTVDTRDYLLTVSSAYGSPVPSIGTNLYAWQALVTCSVDSAVSGRTNSTCSGWAGTGSVPVAGDGNSTDAILLTNLTSSITWLWPVETVTDLWSENVAAAQRPGTKLVDISYGVFSTKTNTVAVALEVLNGTEPVDVASVSGAVGSGVTTGAVKTIVWNAGADWNGSLDSLTFRILGQDAQGAGVAIPAGRIWIPAGQNTGTDPDAGAYSITVTNAFFMDASETTRAKWDAVYIWAVTNGYTFSNAGSGTASNYPVQTISWYDAAKWCNARSQMEGFIPCYNTNTWSCNLTVNGYRLPTAAEWEYAARGGLSGKRFPWGDTITHSNDNYYSSASYTYDVSMTRGFHPLYGASTVPEESGTTNGYGLYAMAGNVMEWCQDTSSVSRALSGGSFDQYAEQARCAYTSWAAPTTADYNIGFRTVQRASSSASADSGTAVPVDTRDYFLIVSSEHGAPVPSIGTNLYAWRATVTASVESAVTSGLTNWTSTGWSGVGSVPPEGGTTNVGGIVLTGLVSSIVWNWDTNYWLETGVSGQGQVTGGNRWIAQGSNVAASVNPDSGWLFMGWSGDASGDYTATNIIVPMVRPVSVTATFSDDADGDGLLNTNETALGTNPRNRDSDGDGMDDSNELVAGTSPTNSASVLDIQLSLSGSANELSWYGVSGRYYQLEYTDDLGTSWLPKGTVVSGANSAVLKLDVGAGAKRFYRIRVSDSPSGF